MTLATSSKGREYIELKEGLRLVAYRPLGNDVWTIGYGHTGHDVYEGLTWTKEQADAALTHRLNVEFDVAVNKVCNGVPTTQGQFDAMVSLAYNIGAGGYLASQVAKLHRQSRYDECADAFEHYDHYHGQVLDALHNRRVEEGQMYIDASPE